MSKKSERLIRKERMEITLPILIDYYLNTKKIKGCSPKTLLNTKSNLGKFVRYLEQHGHSLRLSELTLEHARAYAGDLQGQVTKYEAHPLNKPVPDSTFAPQTVHTYVRYLRTFSAWLVQEGYSKDSIFARLELPKLPQTKIDVLKPEEIQKVLDCINPQTFMGARLYAMVLVCLDSGIRRAELAGLKLADVDWERGVFKVFGKGAKERLVPIGTIAKQAMFRYVQVFRPKPARPDEDNVFLAVDGYTLSVDAIGHMFERLAKRSGITRLHAHLLRHTNGVQYLMLGGDTRSFKCSWAIRHPT
jgi:site-specific recombinase XerD